ncbi:hypothetical protein U2F26_27895 [Micromonospora sp. 4G57]|uniref:DoxX family protein n=1 Tax=Micromonospora sicca TaxID=2202420 RepID=A0ABU5JNS6_9ACTN|nr:MULTISPECIES: hypothetical protein [unclassified Micromonospora]MDZ5446503.1 hypothetical protein [Micromonospora sp. 4G57]MDZ5494028.1 hypothetical protein [Micromonospora sp. 4G53]
MDAITPVSDSSARLLRTVLFLDAAVFFSAALFNFGLEVRLGFTTLRFADSIWQAGTGETVISAVLLAAGLTGGRRLSWVALVMSVLGIAFGLSSDRVQGAARDLHVVMIALAVLVLALLLATGRRPVADRAASPEEAK